MKTLYRLIIMDLPTLFYSILSGIKYNKTHILKGKIRIINMPYFIRHFKKMKPGLLTIGNNFKCNNKIISNSIGLIQPCVFNISAPGSRIEIGNNVGISGSTISSSILVKIGDNVLIGSGCLLTDNDAHPIEWDDRLHNRNEKTKKSPVVIEDDVFIGARSIILKGVTIGRGSVVGAGSVVTRNVPAYSLVAGNPAQIIKQLNQ